jgi:hypothetical protein
MQIAEAAALDQVPLSGKILVFHEAYIEIPFVGYDM